MIATLIVTFYLGLDFLRRPQNLKKNLRRTFDKSVVFSARNCVHTCQKVDEDI